eukprot:2830942-Rhodomonas_salina.1
MYGLNGQVDPIGALVISSAAVLTAPGTATALQTHVIDPDCRVCDTRCPVLTLCICATCLRLRYAMSGTDTAYGATCLRLRYATSATDTAYRGIYLQLRYEKPDNDIACGGSGGASDDADQQRLSQEDHGACPPLSAYRY